jgi:chromosomal replication initiation ATPase DnaA
MDDSGKDSYRRGLIPTLVLGDIREDLNDFAFRVAQHIVDNPGTAFNPLFLQGSSNNTKRHLLHAIGNEIQDRYHNASVYCEDLDYLVLNGGNLAVDRPSTTVKSPNDGIKVLLLDNVTLQVPQIDFLKENAPYLNHLVAQDSQIVMVLNRPLSEVRDILFQVFTVPDKALLLEIDPDKRVLFRRTPYRKYKVRKRSSG